MADSGGRARTDGPNGQDPVSRGRAASGRPAAAGHPDSGHSAASGGLDSARPAASRGTPDSGRPAASGGTPDSGRPAASGGTLDSGRPAASGGTPDSGRPAASGGTPDSGRSAEAGGAARGAGRAGRGHLRIYLGSAAGVGKTYALLGEGHRRAERGADVVVGFAEAHARPQTIALLDGLETVPRTRLEYRGSTFEEMDLDAVLARRPEIALVD